MDPVTVASLKGTLDFYFYRGIPVVRSWPRKPKMPRSPASTQTATNFGDNARALGAMPPALIDAGSSASSGTDWTWRDLWTAAIYGNLWAETSLPANLGATPMMPHNAGRYYNSPVTAAALTTVSGPSGTMRLYPLLIPNNGNYDQLTWEITATSGGNDRLALYGPWTPDLTQLPLVLDTGNIPIASTGVKTQTISIQLVAGWYLLAHQSSVTRTYRAFATAGNLNQIGRSTNGNVQPPATWTIAQAFGAFPNPLGTTPTDSNTTPLTLAIRRA